ncbi:MAG: PP2C family protein-serine/threonine phosphatase [Aggregatilineales bacterium]
MELFRRLFSQSDAPQTPPEREAPGKSEEHPSSVSLPVSTSTLTTLGGGSGVPDVVTRPLQPEAVISTRNEHITFGQSTDVGMVRSNNQDAVLSFFFTSSSAENRPDFGLFVVADGMGGHQDGEKASAMTARIVASYVTSNIYLPMLTDNDALDQPPVAETLVAAVQKANADVIAKVPDGGTTLTAVAVVGDLAYIVHVGDSRVYLITRDGVEQITRDHSLVQRLIELDQITPEEGVNHPQKNVLYRALGQSETLEVDTITRRLPPNSRLLLCSDGLWNQVTEPEISEIAMGNYSPQQACDKLVALANTRGGTDNITAILLYIP